MNLVIVLVTVGVIAGAAWWLCWINLGVKVTPVSQAWLSEVLYPRDGDTRRDV